jgi:hypothetical protein
VPRLGVDRRPLPPRRESLCDQLAKFCDVHKVLHSRGISRLYLANVSKPDERAHPKPGGETNLSRLTVEVGLLEQLLLQHRS